MKDALLPTTQETIVNKDRFDSVLRKIIASKPLPLKDAVGTSPRRKAAKQD
jgi:hypothetical protein